MTRGEILGSIDDIPVGVAGLAHLFSGLADYPLVSFESNIASFSLIFSPFFFHYKGEKDKKRSPQKGWEERNQAALPRHRTKTNKNDENVKSPYGVTARGFLRDLASIRASINTIPHQAAAFGKVAEGACE